MADLTFWLRIHNWTLKYGSNEVPGHLTIRHSRKVLWHDWSVVNTVATRNGQNLRNHATVKQLSEQISLSVSGGRVVNTAVISVYGVFLSSGLPLYTIDAIMREISVVLIKVCIVELLLGYVVHSCLELQQASFCQNTPLRRIIITWLAMTNGLIDVGQSLLSRTLSSEPDSWGNGCLIHEQHTRYSDQCKLWLDCAYPYANGGIHWSTRTIWPFGHGESLESQ